MKLFGWELSLHRGEMREGSPENPATSLADPDNWLFMAFGGGKTPAGVAVTPETAMRSPAVNACVRVLAETIASLPWHVYERLERGKRRAYTHPAYYLLHDEPNPEVSSFVFREVLSAHLLLWGNAFAEIQRTKGGQIVALWPLLPQNMTVKRENGNRVYEYMASGGIVRFQSPDIIHIPGLGFDGLSGKSPVTLMREAVGLSMAAQEWGERFFGQSSTPAGVLEHPGKLTKEAKDRIREQWDQQYTGLAKAHKTLILSEGMKWQAVSVAQKDAQFLETRKFQKSEIAGMFRVPPHLIGDLEHATFSNIENQAISFVIHTLRPWLVRWEQEFNRKLFGKSEYYCEFQIEGLLRGDSTARGNFYNRLFQIAAISPNEIRELENMNPVDGGDGYFVPLNMMKLGSESQPQNEADKGSEPVPDKEEIV